MRRCSCQSILLTIDRRFLSLRPMRLGRKDKLRAKAYDCVMIGAGVRIIPSSFLLFEKLINVVHADAPQAKLCFNTKPSDTAEAACAGSNEYKPDENLFRAGWTNSRSDQTSVLCVVQTVHDLLKYAPLLVPVGFAD